MFQGMGAIPEEGGHQHSTSCWRTLRSVGTFMRCFMESRQTASGLGGMCREQAAPPGSKRLCGLRTVNPGVSQMSSPYLLSSSPSSARRACKILSARKSSLFFKQPLLTVLTKVAILHASDRSAPFRLAVHKNTASSC